MVNICWCQASKRKCSFFLHYFSKKILNGFVQSYCLFRTIWDDVGFFVIDCHDGFFKANSNLHTFHVCIAIQKAKPYYCMWQMLSNRNIKPKWNEIQNYTWWHYTMAFLSIYLSFRFWMQMRMQVNIVIYALLLCKNVHCEFVVHSMRRRIYFSLIFSSEILVSIRSTEFVTPLSVIIVKN